MTRHFVTSALTITLCFAVSLAMGEPRGNEREKSKGGKPASKNQGEHKSEGKQGEKSKGGKPPSKSQGEHKSEGKQGEETHGGKSKGSSPPGGDWSERSHSGKQSNAQQGEGSHAAGKNKTPQASDKEGAAAGATAANRNSSQASGKEGAAAGAAAANRNSPAVSGAGGAAAGAAAANRNSPQVSGKEGAAAGAAAANRNSPAVSGAGGAAAGAAAANRNSPQVSGKEGAVAGAAAANRNSPAVSGAGGAAAGYAVVRNSFYRPNIYGQQWYGDHPGAWAPTGWAAGAAWMAPAWGAVAGYCGIRNATPFSYNYGVNVNAQDGNVIVDGQNVGTTEEFSQQAADLAETGTEAETPTTDQWLPLGVFAMVRNDNEQPKFIVQLAIDKQGILRGNYTDEANNHTSPIHGAVDKETQRAAWTVGGNKQTVMEAGLSDLTDREAPALIHKSGKTDHWLLVRLDPPKQNDADAKN